MLRLRYIQCGRDLVLSLFNESVDSRCNLLNNCTITLKFDGLLVALGTREFDNTRSTAVVRSTSLNNDAANVGTAASNKSLVVLLINLNGLGNNRVEFFSPLFEDLLGFFYLLLGTLDFDLNTARCIWRILSAWNINLSTGFGA